MSHEWNPPPFGAPCWLNVPATDIERAKSFYIKVFNWKMQAAPNADEKKITLFTFPASEKGQSPFCGSIERVDTVMPTKDGNAFRLYFMVEDDKKTVKDIIANGGAQVSEATPEGSHGFITHCSDSEGNGIGIYVSKKE
ncbi:hypothetical protein AJ78_04380 [Emergomyces pasteurianus Ep9510]|uniref:VOC domain-containing protein n=1 Tax=Emergomyces pasteurianus Ep9510 TaxID=1447872 RepID=A0A1J9QGS5_9EURO|nr:hypothetical protein AJ78_04380 [Emergomyces pasteurianus Ep9510]